MVLGVKRVASDSVRTEIGFDHAGRVASGDRACTTGGATALCRLGVDQEPVPTLNPPDHVRVWLIDSPDPDDNPNLEHVAEQTVAMVLNLLVASIMGVIIPLTMTKLGRDPAVGSSVMNTAITDTGGFFIFLGLATIFLL